MGLARIESSEELLEAIKRGDGTPIELGLGDFDLDVSKVIEARGNAILPTSILEGCGAPDTRLHLSDWLYPHWRTEIKNIGFHGDVGLDLTNAPYLYMHDVHLTSVEGLVQRSHDGENWSNVHLSGAALRILEDSAQKGMDRTHAIWLERITFNYFEFPMWFASPQWTNAMTWRRVVVNGAKVGLYSNALSVDVDNANFQCCGIGVLAALVWSQARKWHFERNGGDIVLCDYSFANRIETDADPEKIRRLDRTFPVIGRGAKAHPMPGNEFIFTERVNAGRFNDVRHAATVAAAKDLGF